MSTKAPALLTEREKFEAWVEANYGPALLTDDKLGYVYTDIRAAWRAWQARAAIEAEVRTLAAAPGEFERGWLQGREQEKALWELTAAGQAIENLEDAQNYRWLRDRAINHEAFGEHLAWCVIGTSANDCRPCQGAELDAVIALARAADAAIR